MSAPLAFDPRTAGWSWAEWGLDPLDPETIAEIDAIPLGADLEDYDPDKDPVRSGKIRSFAAPSPMLRVPDQLARFGVPFGVVDKWGSRGYLPMTGRGGFINHWIVSPLRFPARRASLALIINGHSALAGPLANLYMDLDGYVMIVAALSANHGGIGSYNGVSENPNWIGIECEGGPTLTDAQLAMLPRVNAAVAAALGKDASRWCIAHSEYAPKRKVDIGGYMPAIRTAAAQLVRSGPATSTTATQPTRKVPDMFIIYVPGGKDPHVLIAPKFAMGLGPDQLRPLQSSGVPVVGFGKTDYDAIIKAANR